MVVGALATLGLLTVLPDARAAVDGEIRRPQPVLVPARSADSLARGRSS